MGEKFPKGSIVKVHGLQNAVQFNGQIAKVFSFLLSHLIRFLRCFPAAG
jgi:hypothetical protein